MYASYVRCSTNSTQHLQDIIKRYAADMARICIPCIGMILAAILGPKLQELDHVSVLDSACVCLPEKARSRC